MSEWFVFYGSAGCLPDGEPMVFDSLEDARRFVEREWEAVAGDDPAWNDEAGNPTRAYRQAIEAIGRMGDGGGADDPRPGSLYRWTIERSEVVA